MNNMKKLLQINSVVNTGSTGHIVEDIGKHVIMNGWESYIAYGRKAYPSASNLIRVGTKIGIIWHIFVTRLFDLHGLASLRDTKKLIQKIEKIKPDIIHLHNIHGYYVNYKILFSYLAKTGIPVVWTMHDCWAETGHCAYYSFAQCIMWKSKDGCKHCLQKKTYPSSFCFSNSAYNYICKKKYFNLLSENQLTIVTPSKWLSDEIAESYLGHYKCRVINNGIDLGVFSPTVEKNRISSNFTILGVASVWDERKGFADFIKLADLLYDDEEIVLVGLSKKQISSLPKNKNIKGIRRTENQKGLAELYSNSLCFVNPTYEDNFPTTNIEALACGTPVITYRTGGSPEIIDEDTGFTVEPGDFNKIREILDFLRKSNRELISRNCRKRAECYFDKKERYEEYLQLYKEITFEK